MLRLALCNFLYIDMAETSTVKRPSANVYVVEPAKLGRKFLRKFWEA